jgi:hypothetical protein
MACHFLLLLRQRRRSTLDHFFVVSQHCCAWPDGFTDSLHHFFSWDRISLRIPSWAFGKKSRSAALHR